MDKLSVKVLVDKKDNRVVFAEAGCDFVDVLLSFLTLPLGSIARLLGKHSGLGSLDTLYDCVEQLDVNYLHSEACKDMLLHPRSAAAELCEDLKIQNVHDSKPRIFYICKQNDCLVQSTCYYSYTPNGRCGHCGQRMDKLWHWRKVAADKGGGVFVNDRTNFMITDDLRVLPISFMKCCSVLEELGIKDACNLEERVVDFGTEEALNLLKSSLVSKRTLTELCFPDACVKDSVNCSLVIKEEINDDETEKEVINVKLVLNKKNNNVIVAEVGEDFINQLLSFLTFPLGSVLRLLSDNMSLGGCISNLYSSAETMGLDCFKSENRKNMLLTPKLASLYGWKNQILQVDEMTSKKWSAASCLKCYEDNGYKPGLTTPCKHGIREVILIEQNPKLAEGGTDSGGGFADDSRRFMVADNLQISPLSFISAIGEGIRLPISDYVEKDVRIGNVNALSLLRAMLMSKTVLTDVFSDKAKQTVLTDVCSPKSKRQRRS